MAVHGPAGTTASPAPATVRPLGRVRMPSPVDLVGIARQMKTAQDELRGLIDDPKSKRKSVVLTEEGLALASAAAEKLFPQSHIDDHAGLLSNHRLEWAVTTHRRYTCVRTAQPHR